MKLIALEYAIVHWPYDLGQFTEAVSSQKKAGDQIRVMKIPKTNCHGLGTGY